jgi:hypothetical protein
MAHSHKGAKGGIFGLKREYEVRKVLMRIHEQMDPKIEEVLLGLLCSTNGF